MHNGDTDTVILLNASFMFPALRIDAEVCSLMGKLDKMKTFHQLSNGAGEETFEETEFKKVNVSLIKLSCFFFS